MSSSTASQYDKISSQYGEVAEATKIRELEWSAMAAHLGDIRNFSVLDLACGDGLSSRLYKRWGASRVVGVDFSENMLSRACDAEQANPLGIEYRYGDGAQLGTIGQFDLVAACYFLNYAQDEQHLFQMAQVAFDNLAPGQRFVTANANPDCPPAPIQDLSQYGVIARAVDPPMRQGGTLRITLQLQHPTPMTVEFDARHWSRDTYAEAFERAGFKSFTLAPFAISDELAAKYGPGFWDGYLAEPIVCHFICQK